jgi:hypothetical protein
MAIRAIQHHSWLMPPLASIALEAIDFAVGLMKQPPQQHKDGMMAR